MKTTLVALLVLLMVTPCLARSKKSQARIDKRHAAQAQANINRTKAETAAIKQGTKDRKTINEQKSRYVAQTNRQRAHQAGIRNGNNYRKAKAQRSRKHTGF